jgi:hypothetical protein
MLFRYVRGSTNGFEYKNEIFFIVHLVSYEQPRDYYHMLITFDNDMMLKRYSPIFKFEGENIEYCLGLIVEDDRVICSYSTWDCSSKIAIYSKGYIDSILISNAK